MPKKFFKRYLPLPSRVRTYSQLQFFGELLYQPNLWHLNRHSVSGAFAVGLFVAFMPVPFQMLLAAAAAIFTRVNLPLSVALVWITNPVTMPPLFYFAYRIGSLVLDTRLQPIHFELSLHWLAHGLAAIWQPFLLGCFLCGATSAIAGYVTIRILWRWRVMGRRNKTLELYAKSKSTRKLR